MVQSQLKCAICTGKTAEDFRLWKQDKCIYFVRTIFEQLENKKGSSWITSSHQEKHEYTCGGILDGELRYFCLL